MRLMRVSKPRATARRTLLPLPLVGGAMLLLAAAACASAPRKDAAHNPNPSSTGATGRHVITREEIDRTTAADAVAAVRLLRPEWLLAGNMSQSVSRRGPDTLMPGKPTAASPAELAFVYVSSRGDCSPVPMPIERVLRMEFVNPGETTAILGRFAAAGAVLVFVDDTTRGQRH
jgi:hypothetical protein